MLSERCRVTGCGQIKPRIVPAPGFDWDHNEVNVNMSGCCYVPIALHRENKFGLYVLFLGKAYQVTDHIYSCMDNDTPNDVSSITSVAGV